MISDFFDIKYRDLLYTVTSSLLMQSNDEDNFPVTYTPPNPPPKKNNLPFWELTHIPNIFCNVDLKGLWIPGYPKWMVYNAKPY